MQRSVDSLHRATPVPAAEATPPRRISAALSVGSIPEEKEEEDRLPKNLEGKVSA